MKHSRLLVIIFMVAILTIWVMGCGKKAKDEIVQQSSTATTPVPTGTATRTTPIYTYTNTGYTNTGTGYTSTGSGSSSTGTTSTSTGSGSSSTGSGTSSTGTSTQQYTSTGRPAKTGVLGTGTLWMSPGTPYIQETDGMLAYINDQRAAVGAPALVVDPKVQQTALDYAILLSSKNAQDYVPDEGDTTVEERLAWHDADFSIAGETGNSDFDDSGVGFLYNIQWIYLNKTMLKNPKWKKVGLGAVWFRWSC